MKHGKHKPIVCYSDYVNDWNYEKNTNYSPETLTAGSSVKVWWKCSICGHQWQATPNERILHGNKCPKCSKLYLVRKRIHEKGSFESNCPERAKDWDYEKNGELLPSQVSSGSNKIVYWKCHVCGYRWKGMVINHAKSMYSCEKCAIKEKTLEKYGRNPLIETHPSLAEEWDYKHNGDLTPYNVTAHCSERVNWICKKGHRWSQLVSVRVQQHTGCPQCFKERSTSFAEQAIFFYLKKYTKAYNKYRFQKTEIDIFLQDYGIGIEYDGIYFHSSEKSKKRDTKKNQILRENGIRLIRVKESDRNEVIGDTILVRKNNDFSYLRFAIGQISTLIGLLDPLDVNIERDRVQIYEQYIEIEKENSIVAKIPDVAKQWDFKRNGNVRPEYILCTSTKKFYWKCEKGHSWLAQVYSRYSGSGCPYCAGKILVPGENDLLSQNPRLVKEWDYENNGDLKPNEITVNNTKRVWWVCPSCGHHWKVSVANRNSGTGCPKCADKERTITKHMNIVKIRGSFADNYPHLLKEWDYEKNIGLDPSVLPPHCGKTVWWVCSECGHKWAATMDARAKGHGCEKCYKRNNSKVQQQRAVKKKGAFSVSHPHLIKDWVFDRNDGTPDDYSAGSHYRACWKCHLCGYQWVSPIFKRTGGHKCPKCHQ